MGFFVFDAMNRRDFFQPGYLVHAAGQVLGTADNLETCPPDARTDNALLRLARRAMATSFEILLPYDTADALAIANSAFAEIDRLEQQLTVYSDSSEVSRLNRLAPLVPVPVEPGLFNLLDTAAEISRQTDGAYDITAGALIKAWGFYKGPRRVPSPEEITAALSRVGMRHVELNREARSVRFHRPGLEINLGSIGKGYALDRVAAMLRKEWNLPAALLHGGHSSVYAMGTEPGSRRGWSVGIRHPWRPDCRLGVVQLYNRALGTSAATFQHLEYEGRKLGHIIDPRSGWPAAGMASATVVAPSAALADALSTAFFIMGVDKARAYCEAHPEIGAVLIAEQEPSVPVVMGLSPDELILCDM